MRRFQGTAIGYAFAVMGDFHLAEDAAQDAFVEVYVVIGDLRDPAAFASWLRRIVFKHCDRQRRRKRRAKQQSRSSFDTIFNRLRLFS